jgi:hypothetical protein
VLNGSALNRTLLNGSGSAPPPPPTGEGTLVSFEQQVVGPPPDRSGWALNAKPLNKFMLNGSIAPDLTGSGTIIEFEQSIEAAGEGLIISFQQRVGKSGEGLIASFEQNVIDHFVGAGNLIQIEQSIGNIQSGTIIRFEQMVMHDPLPPINIGTHYERNDWSVTVMLNGNQVPNDKLCENIHVERTEGGTATAYFFINGDGSGIQNVESLAGKPITIDVLTPNGNKRIYTGIVDVPELDLIQKKIKINCIDRRTELINSQLPSIIGTIGYWSPIIFGAQPKDTAEELDQRLTTIPYAVDFDAYGNYNLTPKRAKSSPDFTLTGTQIYYANPTVDYTSRARITNKVNIKFQYRYARLWHMQRFFSWTSPIANNICLYLQQGYTLAARSMISAAVNAVGWPLRGQISYGGIQPAGWYCGGIAFSPVRLTGTTTLDVDSSGNPILDSDGKQTSTTTITGGTDFSGVFTNSASWNATTRWAQTITENYFLTVQAPQSQSLYSNVESSNQYSTEDQTDASSWEDYKAYDNPYNQTTNTYFIDNATSRAVLNAAIGTALQIAKTTILNSHRDTRVTFSRFIWNAIDLKHTVTVNSNSASKAAKVNATGKVFSIIHDLNMKTGQATTQVVLALSRSIGMAPSETPLGIPAVPIDNPDPGSTPVILGNHYGEDPTMPAAAAWNGRIGNRLVSKPGFLTSLSTYPEQFVVDTPTIPDAVRNELNKNIGATYNVAIPNDTLTVTF